MKIRPAAIFSFCAFVFFCVFVYLAQDWRMQARLYPWAIGIPMLIFAAIQVILDLKGVKAKQSDDGAPPTPMDFQFTKDIDPADRQETSHHHVFVALRIFRIDLAVGLSHRNTPNDVRLLQVPGRRVVGLIDHADCHRVDLFLFSFCQVADPTVPGRVDHYLAWFGRIVRFLWPPQKLATAQYLGRIAHSSAGKTRPFEPVV